MGVASLSVITRQRHTVTTLVLLNRAQQAWQNADEKHDQIRADVLSLILKSGWAGHSTQEFQRELQTDVEEYRKSFDQAQFMPLPDDLRKSITDVEPDVGEYLMRATEVGQLASRDLNAAVEAARAFQQAFDKLTAADENLSDLFAKRVANSAAQASATASDAQRIIVLACLGAVLVVGIVGRVVTRSVSQSLGTVRAAAEAISAGDLSVRSAVPVRDDIGAVAGAINRMADTLQKMIAELQSEQEQDAFSRQLSEVLEMADTEADTCGVVARGMATVTNDMPMELLVADSSRAHLERAAAHPSLGAPGCPVESPYGCMAVRRGNPVVFNSSETLNACVKLRGRECGPVSAVCVPLSFMGRALGVLHATGPVNHEPSRRVVSQLTTLGILAGSRIGTVRSFQRTQVQASTDGLTGLANRRSLESKVRKLTVGMPYALVLADLDHFKQLNDKHGHDAGDRALRRFSDVLRHSLRTNDHAARWGGEEFVIVLEGRDATAGLEIVERIRGNLTRTNDSHGVPTVTASFGIADTTMAGTLEQIVRIADDGLYQSKEAGRDRATIGDPTRLKETVLRRNAEHVAAINVSEILDEAAQDTKALQVQLQSLLVDGGD